MPDRSRHISQAERNEALSTSLENQSEHEWAGTTLFYAAVHLVDAYLAPRHHPKRHADRQRLIRTLPGLRRIRNHYRELEERSRDARYECLAFSAQGVQALHRNDFDPLKRHLRRSLGL